MRVRYMLRDPKILKWVMDHPGRGKPHTIRSLSEAVGLTHHSAIGHLVSGRTHECDYDVAHAIAREVGVAVLVLFAPPASPDTNEPSTNIRDSVRGDT